MITKIPAEQRHYQDLGFLKTHWLFSFSNYYDPENMQFGNLRVFNDDIVMPGSGFPDHPHDTMEIVTVVLDGTLTHGDSLGNEATISAGEIQRMSAGEGIVHSEFNKHDKPVHLYQLWFYPNQKTTADYEQILIPETDDSLKLLASHEKIEHTLHLKADAKVFKLDLSPGKSAEYNVAEGNGLLVYVTSGALEIQGERLGTGDQARIVGPEALSILAKKNTEALVVGVKL